MPGLSRKRPIRRGTALPPAAAQITIADFLDRETGRIDALVEKKQRLIELLEEKRTALISHIVTKGLDPTVPMKDSGIPWLGQIPAHSEVKPAEADRPRRDRGHRHPAIAALRRPRGSVHSGF